MSEAPAEQVLEREVRVPEVELGDEIGSYRVVDASSTRLALGTNYGLLLFLLVLGVAMIAFDIWIFQQRVLSHVLLAWNGMTALAFKGAMIVLPLIGIPFVLHSLGRRIAVDAQAGVIERRWLFAFGSTAPLASVDRIEIAFSAPVTESSDTSVRLKVVDAKGEALLVFPEVGAERDDILSKDTSEFAKMLAIARYVATLTRAPLTVSGPMEALSGVNRRLAEQAIAL